MRKYGAGPHLKTAGTTWLEELIGLALAGGDGLAVAKEIYAQAVRRNPELCAPCAAVIDINWRGLPDPDEVLRWNGEDYARALRHEPDCPECDGEYFRATYQAHLPRRLSRGDAYSAR